MTERPELLKDTRESVEKVRTVLAMRDAGYHILPEPSDVEALLFAYDMLAFRFSDGETERKEG